MFRLGRKFYIGLAVWLIAVLCNQGWLPNFSIAPFNVGYSNPYSDYLSMLLTLVLFIIALRLMYVFFKFILLSLIKQTFCKQNLFEIIAVIAIVTVLWALPSRAEVVFIAFKKTLQTHAESTTALVNQFERSSATKLNTQEALEKKLSTINQNTQSLIYADITIAPKGIYVPSGNWTGISAIFYDFGYAVPSLIYNAADHESFQEGRVLCDSSNKEGGFIKRLAPQWFLCKRLHSV